MEPDKYAHELCRPQQLTPTNLLRQRRNDRAGPAVYSDLVRGDIRAARFGRVCLASISDHAKAWVLAVLAISRREGCDGRGRTLAGRVLSNHKRVTVIRKPQSA